MSNFSYYPSSVTSGAYLTATTNGTSWTGPSVYVTDMKNPKTIDIQGDANITGDLKVQGVSIKDSLERIEERLAILRPNEELEEKWENLRGLRKAYMELEAEIKEKEQVWKILKR